MTVRSHLARMDMVLFGAALLLAFFGIAELVGMTHNNPLLSAAERKQAIALALGVSAMFIFSFLLMNQKRILDSQKTSYILLML